MRIWGFGTYWIGKALELRVSGGLVDDLRESRVCTIVFGAVGKGHGTCVESDRSVNCGAHSVQKGAAAA
jgi:hypothetical protein